MSEPLRESLLSVRWLRTHTQQLFHDLPFIVSETEDLRFVKRSHNMLVMTATPDSGTTRSSRPSLVIGHLKSDAPIDDRMALSHSQLTQVKSLEVLEILDEGETKVAGIHAYHILAKARNIASGDIVVFHQILVFQEYRYLLIHSSVKENASAVYQPQFAAVVASLKFKQVR